MVDAHQLSPLAAIQHCPLATQPSPEGGRPLATDVSEGGVAFRRRKVLNIRVAHRRQIIIKAQSPLGDLPSLL